MNKYTVLLTSLLCIPFSTLSMTIDSMLKVSDELGTGVYTVTNDLDYPSFIKIEASKVVIDKNGDLSKIKYDKSNLKDWEIALTQSKVILDPKRKKNIGVRSLCSEGCDRSKDSVFAIKFSPTPYVKDGVKKMSVVINYGYESIFLIPAKKPEYKYTIKRNGNNILFHNQGNSLLRVFIDQCKDNKKSADCSRNTVILAGRKKEVSLPVNARQSSLNLNIMGYDNSFYKKAVLSINSPVIRK